MDSHCCETDERPDEAEDHGQACPDDKLLTPLDFADLIVQTRELLLFDLEVGGELLVEALLVVNRVVNCIFSLSKTREYVCCASKKGAV